MLEVVCPFDLKKIKDVERLSWDTVESYLARARELADGIDERLSVRERIAILQKTADILERDAEKLALAAAEEGGKPLSDSRVELRRAVEGVRNAAEELPHLIGREIPMELSERTSGRLAYTFREPIGVVVAVSAFNHPVNLIVHQVIPAVATGCPVLVKPASNTPISCINVVNALYEAGLPEDLCRVVVTDRESAEKLVTDPRVDFLSFIGSAEVGWGLRSKVAPGVRCALEHGGVAPVIFESDADIEAALPLLSKAGFYHAGQVCVSVQRVFVAEEVISDLTEGLKTMADKLVVGDPRLAATEVGPLIQPKEVDRVEAWVNEAVKGGGKLVTGGKRLSDTTYAPTVILNPPADADISTKEVFGPVVSLYSYTDRKEAIQRANSLPFSFQAAVFTKDIDVALDSVCRINGAAVMVNDHTAFRADWMPFAGRKHSGLGVGGIPYTMHEMTAEKLVVLKSQVLG